MDYYVDASVSIKYNNIIALSDSSGKILFHKRINTKKFTVAELEYRAIIEGLCYAGNGDTVYSDALICVNQILNNTLACNQLLVALRDDARKLLRENPKVKLKWIKRENNLAGIYLEKYIKRFITRQYRRRKFDIINCPLKN